MNVNFSVALSVDYADFHPGWFKIKKKKLIFIEVMYMNSG